MLNRRVFLAAAGSAAAFAGFGAIRLVSPGFAEDRPVGEAAAEEVFEVTRTEEEWRQLLSRHQFAVLRQAATEPPGSSELLYEHRKGAFHCVGCDLPVYSSDHKYESGTGWPSFWQPIDADAIRTKFDNDLGYPRKEVHCRRCGGHFGHIFGDGPQPTGERHCINGIALKFVAAAGA